MRGANLPQPKPVVTLEDVFGTYTATLDRGHRLCAPTNKNGEDPIAPQRPEHLTGYDFTNVAPNLPEPNDVQVDNQFGTYTVDVRNPVRLLVPTAKSLVAPPPPRRFRPTSATSCATTSRGSRVRDRPASRCKASSPPTPSP